MKLIHSSIRRALAADYAVGLMSPRVHRRFEQYLRHDRDLRQEVSTWQNVLATMSHELTPVEPAEAVWQHICKRLNFIDAPAPRQIKIWQWLTGTAVVASLLLGIVFNIKYNAPPIYEAALQQTQTGDTLHVSRQGERITVARLSSAPAADKSLELWIVPQTGAPISLGVLHNTAATVIQLSATQMQQMQSPTTLAISLEPIGGSPTGLPTGKVLYQGIL